MAAYASLVSVMHIIQTIHNHPRPPISFYNKQLKSLTNNITFLQQFLETHSIEDDGLESRIADAAYAAEDIIESHIADQIEPTKTLCSTSFHISLRKVIKDLALIQRDMPSFATKTGIKDDDHRRSSTCRDKTAVGLDDVVVEIMNKLTWNQSSRQIVPIVGMGGIGKTTLASNVYVNLTIVQYFDFRGWATISQEYDSKETLVQLLLCFSTMSRQRMSEMSEDKLEDMLYKSLFGRRYLIVLDDIWSIEVWDKVKAFFPDNNNGSAIMLTTRLSNLGFELGGSRYEMSFLDEDRSWNLFCKSTFGEEEICPDELEGIGKKIVENCKGLPLSIVVVGGLLSKSKRTREYWLYIAGNLNSTVNLQDDERSLKILRLSYKELPVYLKPCFLYMGVYPEDCVIDVSELMRLWVAEGFLKPISGKLLEAVAKEYLNELVGRNLVLVHETGYSGETIKCKIHDLLVDVCVREGKKHKFLCIARDDSFNNNLLDLNIQRRIVVHDYRVCDKVIDAFLSRHQILVRSITCKHYNGFPKSCNARLLRVYNAPFSTMRLRDGIVNCRYISGLSIQLSYSTLWNLQTLYVQNWEARVATSDIWNPQLRHVFVNLLDPPPSDGLVLGNLQTLSRPRNFRFSDDVVKRIPNLKELGVSYEGNVDWSSVCLNNVVRLINLESLYFKFPSPITSELSFPLSLKELSLKGSQLDWGEMGTKIGTLPHLRVLKLESGSFVGEVWETVEGQFGSLKYLEISDNTDLKYWRTESCAHFPCLERIFISGLTNLEAIPFDIGDTLKSIEIIKCSDSAIFSANEILMEQEGLGNEGLQVKVLLFKHSPDVESLAAPNFHVKICII